MRKDIRTPEISDFINYDGAHCKKLWIEVGPDWKCPCCQRTKYQIMRWTTRWPKSPNRFKDWIAILHRHHDHGVGYGSSDFPRFSQTVICDQCNVADGTAKRKLRLPDEFSFAPDEIAKFIAATPHDRHKIDYLAAKTIYGVLGIFRPKTTKCSGGRAVRGLQRGITFR